MPASMPAKLPNIFLLSSPEYRRRVWFISWMKNSLLRLVYQLFLLIIPLGCFLVDTNVFSSVAIIILGNDKQWLFSPTLCLFIPLKYDTYIDLLIIQYKFSFRNSGETMYMNKCQYTRTRNQKRDEIQLQLN